MTIAAGGTGATGETSAATPSPAFLTFVLIVAAFSLAADWPLLLREGDIWWHLATGDWILAHHAAPHTDPFSFSMAGQPWVAHEWLAEALMALAFRAGGWSGLALLTAVAFAATVGIVAARAMGRAKPAVALLLVGFVIALLVPSLNSRPHMLAMPLVAFWTDRLLAAPETGRAPSLWLALTMTLWANLHGGFAFGLALIVPFALEAVLETPAAARPRAALSWAAFGGASLAAALATPFGVEGLLFPIKLLGVQSLDRIGEWQSQNFAHFGAMEAALLGLLFLALTTSLRLSLLRALLLAALVQMALSHVRHETLFAIVGAMLLIEPLSRLAPATSPSTPFSLRSALAALPVALVVAAFRLLTPIERAEDSGTPMAALAAVPEALRAQPVLNDYDFGGYLIANKVKPYIDGRTDLYGDAFIKRFGGFEASPAELEDALARNCIRWTIFKPDRPIVALLDEEPGWRRLFVNAQAVVHVREAPLAATKICNE